MLAKSSCCRDWTLTRYLQLCERILSAGYTVVTVRDHIRKPLDHTIIVRHDVDRFPNNALHMAEIERALGIRSTYYIRKTAHTFREEIIRGLSRLGHEVGYHYEVVHKARGNIRNAADLFAAELSLFRKITNIDTTSAHGSPLSRWNNLDLWTAIDPADFGLLGDAYLNIDYFNVGYYTDTGRTWVDNATNLRDRVNNGDAGFPIVHGLDQLMELITSKKHPIYCIQTHPERWNYSLIGLARSMALDFSTNVGKLALRTIRSGL